MIVAKDFGYLIANIEFSMKDNDIKKNIQSYFK